MDSRNKCGPWIPGFEKNVLVIELFRVYLPGIQINVLKWAMTVVSLFFR